MGATRTQTSTTVAAGSYFIIGRSGASLASASSITVTDGFHTVTGSATINTINGGKAGMGIFLYRPIGATWTLGTSGNIKATNAAPTDRATLLVTPDGNTWYGESANVSVASASNDITVSESGGIYTLTFNPANVTLDEFTGPLAITKGGTGQTAKDEAFDALSPTTTRGDLIIMGSAGDNVRLAVGANKSILASNGTDPSWSDTPAVTSLTTDDGSAAFPGLNIGVGGGMYAIGTNDVGFEVAGTGRLSLDTVRLAPVTDFGMMLGDSNQQWSYGYIVDDRGFRAATLANGANTVATFPLTTTNAVVLEVTLAAKAVGTGPNTSVRGGVYQLVAYNNAGTISVAAATISTGAGVHTNVGAFNFNALSAAITDAGGNVANLVFTTGASAGTFTSIDCKYKVRVIYGDPTFTELL